MRSPPAILGPIFLMKTGSTEASREEQGLFLPVALTTRYRFSPGVTHVPLALSPLILPARFLRAGVGEAHVSGRERGGDDAGPGTHGPTIYCGLSASCRKEFRCELAQSLNGSESVSEAVGGYPTDRAAPL